jgi:hypothetical protein
VAVYTMWKIFFSGGTMQHGNMDMCCRGGKGRIGGGETEYCVKNTAVPLADVISGLVEWHFQTQQETNVT